MAPFSPTYTPPHSNPPPNLIQITQHHLSHLHAQTQAIQKKLHIIDSRIKARQKTKNSIFEKQREDLERKLRLVKERQQQSQERNDLLQKKYLNADTTTKNAVGLHSTTTKIELDLAKAQFMRAIQDSFHELETEERKRRIRILRDTEERIKTTEDLKRRAREQWHEEMMLKEALAQKEVQLRLAEEEIKKEALERQLLRKKFEEEQLQKRRVLQDQAAIAMEQFKYREESSGAMSHHIDADTGLHMLHKEVSRIYERPTSELRVSSLDASRGAPLYQQQNPYTETIPPGAKSSTQISQQHHHTQHAQAHKQQHRTPTHRTQPPRNEHIHQREPAPEIPQIKIKDMPRKAMSESLSESNMTVTEDEMSMLDHNEHLSSRKAPSDDSVYYQDGYSTVNESVEEPASASSYTRFKQQRRQQQQNHDEQHRAKRPKTPQQPLHRDNTPHQQHQISHRTLTNLDDSLMHEDSVEDEFENNTREQAPEPRVEEDNEFMKAFRKSLQQEIKPIKVEDTTSHRVQTPPPEMIDSARREKDARAAKQADQQASIYSPSFDDIEIEAPKKTKPSKPAVTMVEESTTNRDSSPVIEAAQVPPATTPENSVSPETSRASTISPDTQASSSRAVSPTIEQSSDSSKPGEDKSHEAKARKKSILSLSRLKKSRMKRSPKEREQPPAPELDEKSESELDYYTTESGSEAPQSAFERRACSQVRRHLQTTFPVKIVMGLKELAASIEDDMSKQYTKGTLSSRLRKRNANNKYPFPYEKRFAGRDSPLRDYEGDKRVALIEAAIDSDEEMLEKCPYPVKSELFLDIIKYTPSVFVTKQLYEKLIDSDISLEDWTPEFLEQKCQIRGPTLEMWKVIISHIKFLYKTDSSKKNQVVSAFAAVLTPRPSAKLGTDFIKNRDETVERMKKLIKYACGAKKKGGRLSIGGLTGSSSKRKGETSPSHLSKSSPHSQTQSALMGTSKSFGQTPKLGQMNKSKSSGIILGGRKPGLGGGSAFGGSSILDRLKTGQDLEDDEEDDDDDLNVAVFQAPASSGFGLGGVSFGRGMDAIEDEDFDEFDL